MRRHMYSLSIILIITGNMLKMRIEEFLFKMKLLFRLDHRSDNTLWLYNKQHYSAYASGPR